VRDEVREGLAVNVIVGVMLTDLVTEGDIVGVAECVGERECVNEIEHE
jgi:hypothetical protein